MTHLGPWCGAIHRLIETHMVEPICLKTNPAHESWIHVSLWLQICHLPPIDPLPMGVGCFSPVSIRSLSTVVVLLVSHLV